MKKKIVIVGKTDYAILIRYYLESDAEREVVAFAVNEGFIDESTFEGLPVVSIEEMNKVYSPDQYELVLAVGYRNMNELRKKVYKQCKLLGYSFPNFIHSTAILANNLIIGEGNIIMENVVVAPFAEIGNSNIIWNSVNISHHNKIGSFNSISVGAGFSGCVTIRDNCFIGNNVTIKDHICIESFTLAGAGSYVANNTTQYEVIVPQRSITLINKKSIELI